MAQVETANTTTTLTPIPYDQEEEFNTELQKVTDDSIKEKLKQVKELILKRINLERDFRIEQAKLEAKYEKIYLPLYKERKEIVDGTKTIEKKDVEGVLKDVKISDEVEQAEKGIPQFWLKCIKNSPQFTPLINKNDETILKHLEDITVELEENGNFELLFHFASNEFFQHAVLSRKFILDDKQTIQKCVATKIQWASEEANPTLKRVKKKLKNSILIKFRIQTWKGEDYLQGRKSGFFL